MTLTVDLGQNRVAVSTTDGLTLTWDELCHEYTPSLLAYARSRGVTCPEDLIQDVLVSAIEGLPKFQGDSIGLRSYLFTIAYRRIADDHRRRYRRREVLVGEHEPWPETGPDVEEIVTSKCSAIDVLGAFAILTPRERRVLELRIFEEASPARVASLLGITNGNVRIIQARALVKLRRHLSGQDGEVPHVSRAALALIFLKGLGRDSLTAVGGGTPISQVWPKALATVDSLRLGGALTRIGAATILTAGSVFGLSTLIPLTPSGGSVGSRPEVVIALRGPAATNSEWQLPDLRKQADEPVNPAHDLGDNEQAPSTSSGADKGDEVDHAPRSPSATFPSDPVSADASLSKGSEPTFLKDPPGYLESGLDPLEALVGYVGEVTGVTDIIESTPMAPQVASDVADHAVEITQGFLIESTGDLLDALPGVP